VNNEIPQAEKENQFGCRTSLCFTDRETQEEILLGGTNPFLGQFLHPSPVQSSRSVQRMQTLLVPKQILKVNALTFSNKNCTKKKFHWFKAKPITKVNNQIPQAEKEKQFGCRTGLCFTDQRTSIFSNKFYGLNFSNENCTQKKFYWFKAKPITKLNNKILLAKKEKQFRCRTSLCFKDQETHEEILLGRTNPFLGQFLHQSLSPASETNYIIMHWNCLIKTTLKQIVLIQS